MSRRCPSPTRCASEESRRTALIEAAAEASDELMLKYLEGEEISDAEIETALHAGTRDGSVVRVRGIGAAEHRRAGAHPDGRASRSVPAEVGSRTTSDGKTIEPDPAGPFVAQVFKVTADPFVGRLTYFRVISGALKAQGHVHNANRREDERIGNILGILGKEQVNVPQVGPGDIVAVAKLASTHTATPSSPTAGRPSSCAALLPRADLQVAVEPESKADLDKLGQALSRIVEEEPCMRVAARSHSQTILTAMGDAHVDVIVERLKRKFGAAVKTGTPGPVPRDDPSPGEDRQPLQAPDRWTRAVRPRCDRVRAERGGRRLRVRRPDRRRFRAEAVHPRRREGPSRVDGRGRLAGYPVVDLKATLVDGSYHTVDSSEMAFKVAASQALKQAFTEADPALLEPILEVEVTVPDEYMGDVMGQITAKRGHVLGMNSVDGTQHLRAQVPQAEMFHYATELRSITQGRGRFAQSLDHYAEVPHTIAEKVIAEHQAKATAPERGH